MNICLNGDIVPVSSVEALVLNESLPLGAGVFETFKIKQGKVDRLEAHLNRLYESAEIWNLSPPSNFAAMDKGVREFLGHSDLQTGVWRGKILMTKDFWWFKVASLVPVLDEIYREGVNIVGTEEVRVKPKAKATSPLYAQYFEKYSEAFEVVFFDQNDHLLEGNITNVFILTKEGAIVTPKSGILLGITRKFVIETLKAQGELVLEREILKSEMKEAQAIFLTNSIKGVVPVARFEDWEGDDFSLAQKLQNFLFED